MVSGTGTRWPSDGCNATAKKLPCAAGGSWSCTPRPSSTARANWVQLASSGMVDTLEGEASFPLGGNKNKSPPKARARTTPETGRVLVPASREHGQ